MSNLFSNLCFECLHVMQLNPTVLCSRILSCLQTFVLSLLITEYRETKFCTEANSLAKYYALQALVSSRHRRGMWETSSLWRMLPWLWKPAPCRLEETSAPHKCLRCWGTPTRRATVRTVCGNYLVANLLKKVSCMPAVKSELLHGTHYLEFSHRTVNRNYPEQFFFSKRLGKRKAPTTKQISWNIASHSQKLKVSKCTNLFLLGFFPFRATAPQKI